MGIKGIYGEIGPGQRIALIKLAIDNFERTGRPLRIAIDISIWQFQIQSGKGGSNPALRTLYYRLLRLLSMDIQPLFVFDGPQKPPFKRNKRIGTASPSLTDFNTKQLLNLFDFPYHIAPGEAEAECALLQREGLVDAVLSEDVDTLMFGCGKTLRNWCCEGSRGNHAPTHVTVYDAQATAQGKSGLDREGMILVALMSGGDYITEGVPGCGIKVACEAARAGFGKSLCRLSRTDTSGLNKWRENLVHELQTNESKHFRVKHKALKIPDSFPNEEVLGYYTYPVVSSASKLARLKDEIEWDGEIDIMGLRGFVAEAFGWTHRTGAKKFIRGLAPALLVQKVRARASRRASGFDDPVYTSMNEMMLVKEICGRRQHFSTDGITELRLVYHPASIVGLDPDAELDESEDYGRDGLAPPGEDENPQSYRSDDESDGSWRARSRSPKKRYVTNYDPTEHQKIWVPETIVKVGIPLMVEDYDEALRNPRKPNKSKVISKRTTTNGGMPKGALDRYVTIVKPVSEVSDHQSSEKLHSVSQDLPPAYLAPVLKDLTPSRTQYTSKGSQSQGLPANQIIPKRKKGLVFEAEKSKPGTITQKKCQESNNPWTIGQSFSPTTPKPYISTVHVSKPGLASEKSCYAHEQNMSPKNALNVQQDFIRSRPLLQSPLGKHFCPISSSSSTETPSDPSRVSQSISPTKKRVSKTSIAPKVSVANTQQTKAVIQEVVEILSSPIPGSRPALPLDSRTEGSPAKAVQQPILKTVEVNEKRKGKKFVIVRESLVGAWKEVGQEPTSERTKGRAWRASAVEVLDMTGN